VLDLTKLMIAFKVIFESRGIGWRFLDQLAFDLSADKR